MLAIGVVPVRATLASPQGMDPRRRHGSEQAQPGTESHRRRARVLRPKPHLLTVMDMLGLWLRSRLQTSLLHLLVLALEAITPLGLHQPIRKFSGEVANGGGPQIVKTV
jgi:hypothetical protein